MSKTISFWPVASASRKRCCWREGGKLEADQCEDDVHQNSRDAKVCDRHSIAWVGLSKQKKDALKAVALTAPVPIELRKKTKEPKQ